MESTVREIPATGLAGGVPPTLAGASRFQLQRVESQSQWRHVHALRAGDAHDGALNATTFLLMNGERAIATTRTSVSAPERRRGIPCEDAYRASIETRCGSETTLVEASHTFVRPGSSTEPRNLLFLLCKAHILQCLLENADWLLCAVREPEIGFYRRIFNMEIVSGPEDYPGPRSRRVLMGLDYRRHSRLLSLRIPALAITRDDHEEYLETGRIGFARGMR